MLSGNLLQEFENWKNKKNSLPLILRGARQTGKTTLLKESGFQFSQCIYLNLEDSDTRKLFTLWWSHQSFITFPRRPNSISLISVWQIAG